MHARTTLLLLAALAFACCGAYAQTDACKTMKAQRLTQCKAVQVPPKDAICVDYKSPNKASKTRTSTGVTKSTQKDTANGAVVMPTKSWSSSRRAGYSAGAACKVLNKALPWGNAAQSTMSTTNMPCNAGLDGKKTAIAWTTLSCCPAPSEEERKACRGAKQAKKAERAAKKAAKAAAATTTTAPTTTAGTAGH